MGLTQGTKEVESKELSAREIFNRIVKGQVVRIPYDPALAAQLKNHLGVIKHREKKLFKSLGLDWVSAIIKFSEVQINTDYAFDISLTAPKTRRKYPAFSLAPVENKDNAASTSTT